jgi:type III restriction enzyme
MLKIMVLSQNEWVNDIPSPLTGGGVGGEAGMNFSVEMETGTGKTYVYLRTIYELNKLYGFKKFVIVVPSIAIREGVLKNLQTDCTT